MFKKVTLEVSLKPFKRTDEDYIRSVAERIFEDWTPLIRGRETVSVMLWCSDGSEILEYKGNPDEEFEWCYFLGTANLPLLSEGEDEALSLHSRSRIYMEDRPSMTYGTLKSIVSILKEVGSRRFPRAKIEIGETFDIGPEFARSDFKYNRHTEITSGGSGCDKYGFVDSTARLSGDSTPYAAYPDGIPDGTPFGRFFGKQAQVFLSDMGFDYIWLSNGLGFSADPWEVTGKIFDGESFHPERLADTRAKVFEFWKLFRSECSFPIETRGTNNSVGIDYASDGVPLYDIYTSVDGIAPPPNSPWAAINGNYGMEIMGHMTRICELPGNDYLFRFYLHDPWWVNSPWYDRYGGAPMDIYLPMAICRIDKSGSCHTPTQFNILSIDNSFGNMPELCVYEPLPHFLKAEKDSPDKPAPFVWVYPMRDYTRACGEEHLRAMMQGDRFIEGAINSGFPLNCVCSSDIFATLDPSVFRASVIISPVPIGEEHGKALEAFKAAGGSVIVYGDGQCLKDMRAKGFDCISIAEGAEALFSAASRYGYSVWHSRRPEESRSKIMTVSRSDGADFISVYNPDTTSVTKIKTPLGSPVPIGKEIEFKEGVAEYRFARWEHLECRVFVEQEEGVVSLNEVAPSNCKYRRKIWLRGLKNATVRLFPEGDLEGRIAVCNGSTPFDGSPVPSPLFKPETDEKYGWHLKGEGISGDFQVLFQHPEGVNIFKHF